MLCVGLDPDLDRLPAPLAHAPDALERFCCAIVDATADLVCAYKPQIAHFSAQRAEAALEAVCAHIKDRYPHIPILLDAKRGDIGTTAEFYAREVFERYGGRHGDLQPVPRHRRRRPAARPRRGVRDLPDEQPGFGELQDLDVAGRPLYERVAEMVATRWTQSASAASSSGPPTRPSSDRFAKSRANCRSSSRQSASRAATWPHPWRPE